MSRCLLIAIFVPLLGCDPGITVINSAPELTKIGPLEVVDGDVSLTVWIRDHEQDAVDLDLEIDGTPVDNVGGHGIIGLTSSREDTGREHQLILSSDIAAGDSVTVTITPTDRQGAAGPTSEVTLTAE